MQNFKIILMRAIIEAAWEDRSLLEQEETQNAIRSIIKQLDGGDLRVAEPTSNGWQVNEWVKKAVVLYFPIQKMETFQAGPMEFHDKIPLKKDYAAKGIRVVPHAVARQGAYIASGVILMPSYVNIGAYVDSGSMIDTWATIGSCAQIGKNVHLSGGVGIGGVLEPLQAALPPKPTFFCCCSVPGMEFSLGGPKWESSTVRMEQREKAAESITWATSQTEVEEAAIEEAMATVAAREAEAAGAAAAVEARAIGSEEANAWVKNASVTAVATAILPVPMVAIPAVTVAIVAAAAAAKWRRRERRLRQAQLQIFLERSASL